MKHANLRNTIVLLLFLIFVLLPIRTFAEMPPPPPDDSNTDNGNGDGNNDDNGYIEAELLRATNGYKIYEVKNDKRHWIPTAEIFDAYNFDWSDVQIVSENQLNSYPRAKLLRATGDRKVYYLTESGMVRHIPSPEVFNSYGNNWEDIFEVSPDELNTYEPNSLIRAEGDCKVYLLENGKKRWIQTAEEFNNRGYDWSKIAPVNQIEINYYTERATVGNSANQTNEKSPPTDNYSEGTSCTNECSAEGTKQCSGNAYQICGNYDNDLCLEWSSIINCSSNTVCQDGNCVQQECIDSTPYKQCSSEKPLYCDNGNLINKCSICGCPSNQYCEEPTGLCKTKITLKGGVINSEYMNGAHSVYVSGNYAYVAGADSNSLAIIDISNPSSPVVVGGLIDSNYMNYAHSVHVSGNYAYVAAKGSDSLSIVNVSNPFSPLVTGTVTDSTYMNGALSVYVSGNYAYVAGGWSGSLAVVDISHPSSPSVVGGIIDSILEYAYSVYISGNYAYLTSHDHDALVIVDISNPSSPEVVGKVINSTYMNGPYLLHVSGDYAYVAGKWSDSLAVVDISNPSSPVVMGGVIDSEYMNGARGIYVSGNYAYVAALDSDALAVIDISEF